MKLQSSLHRVLTMRNSKLVAFFGFCFLGCIAATGPEQVFVNYGNRTDQMFISWLNTVNSAASVQYGLQSKQYTWSASSTSGNYSVAFYTSGFIHHAELTGLVLLGFISSFSRKFAAGLKAGQVYYYRVGDDVAGWSQEYNFTAHPGVGPSMTAVFALIGDLGQTEYSLTTIDHIQQRPDILSIIHVGDLSYADLDEPRWDSWYE